MPEGLTIAELIFGGNDNNRIRELYFKKDMITEEAKEVLAAIQHPEMRGITSDLESQMQRGKERVRYSMIDTPGQFNVYMMDAIGELDVRKAFLFTDTSYNMGVVSSFCRLLGKAFPNYKLPEGGQIIGEVELVKV